MPPCAHPSSSLPFPVGRSATNDLQCINMTTAWLLLLVNIAATWCCSTIHVSPPDGGTVIGRTMELENPGSETTFGGLLLGVDPSDPDTDDLPYNVSVHRQDERVGKLSLFLCDSCKPFKTTIGNPKANKP